MQASLYPVFKQAILAESDPTFSALRDANETGQMALWYNQEQSPMFTVWRSSATTSEILNGVVGANLTPLDTPDGTAMFTNRALVCQAKQINLQMYLQKDGSLPVGQLNIRQTLQDALTNVPSGAGGALLDAGWAGTGKVKDIISRPCTRAEKIWATGTGSTGVPGNLGAFEGTVSNDDILNALRS
jgi:hypothetical protein